MTHAWRDSVPVSGSIELPPDPRVLSGLGRNHSLESALADLVDNAIDAGASEIMIRLVRRDGRLRALYVVDNGRGISANKIDVAMTVGGQRQYGAGDLGRFGVGLKAASLSHARVLTVLTRAAGEAAVGRQWVLKDDRVDFHCGVVTPDVAAAELDRDWAFTKITGTGAVVRWDDVTAFPATDDPVRVEQFISHASHAVRTHLGLVFHRILESDPVRVGFDVEDVDAVYPGPRLEVTPINPFGYSRSGRAGYPKELRADGAAHKLRFHCHIWPGRASSPQFRLPGGAVDRQGLYFYRRRRLLHAGGWDGVHAPDRRLQLARVSLDIDNDVAGLFSMNPEKTRVLVGPDFAALAESARATDGSTFADYLRDAEQTFRASRRRSRDRRKMLPPGKGFADVVRRAIEDEVPLLDDEDGIDIRWADLADESFFHIDRERRTLWINKQYRPILLAGRRGGLNDAPLVKTLLYLLMENLFEGGRLGSRDKDNIELWQDLLTTAVKSERHVP